MILDVVSLDPRARLINAALQRNDLSFRWLAQRVETSHVSVSDWLNGKGKPRDPGVWQRMLEVLREYEQDSRGDKRLTVKRTGIRSIPVFPGLSAGGMKAIESDVEMLEVKDWGNDRERWGRVIDGYSMSPLLEPGDIAIFEDRQWEPYHVVHAYDAGEDCVKIARRLGNLVQLIPANQDYQILDGKNATVKGVLVERIRKGPNDEKTTTEYPHGMRYRPEYLDSVKAA